MVGACAKHKNCPTAANRAQELNRVRSKKPMKSNYRAFLTASLLACSFSAFADVQICELHPNTCPPNTFPIKDLPVGECPQNSCAYSLPPASLLCDSGVCTAFPQGVLTQFYYSWSASNSNVSISPAGAELFYSCTQNTNVLISVHVSDNSSPPQLAQQLVFCRRPLGGNQHVQ